NGKHRWAAVLRLGSGGVGIVATIAKNVAYAMRSEIDSLPGLGPRATGMNAVPRVLARLWCRGTVAYLHSIQPLARVRGRIRGMLLPPEVALPRGRSARSAARGRRGCASARI